LGYFAGMMYSGVDLGVRLILPCYPFLYVLAGRLAAPRSVVGRSWALARLTALAALVLTAVSVLRSDPHQLAYFNELVGGPAYRRLADSNLDWGQDLRSLKEEMDRRQAPIIYLSYYGTFEPEWYGIRYEYLPTYGRMLRISPPSPERVGPDVKP